MPAQFPGVGGSHHCRWGGAECSDPTGTLRNALRPHYGRPDHSQSSILKDPVQENRVVECAILLRHAPQKKSDCLDPLGPPNTGSAALTKRCGILARTPSKIFETLLAPACGRQQPSRYPQLLALEGSVQISRANPISPGQAIGDRTQR